MSGEERHLSRGIAAEERFVYEIMLLCLVIPLTSLQKLRKIEDIQNTKEKTASVLSTLTSMRSC
jgi:hypothetical protein